MVTGGNHNVLIHVSALSECTTHIVLLIKIVFMPV